MRGFLNSSLKSKPLSDFWTEKSMKQRDLDILLREGEGSMLEYKEGFSSSFARDLVALPTVREGKSFLESAMK